LRILNSASASWYTDMSGLEWCYIVAMFSILFIAMVIMNVIIALELGRWVTDKICYKLEEMEDNKNV